MLLITINIVLYYILRKLKLNSQIDNEKYKNNLFLLLISTFVSLLYYTSPISELGRITFLLTNIPAYIITGLLIVSIGRKFKVYLGRQVDENKKDDEVIIEEFLNKLYNNENFHTAFSTSLPKGKSDEEFGIDYIPFILQNIDDRRRRFKENSTRFFQWIIGLGLIFIIIVCALGFILLNDDSIGLGRKVSKIQTELGNTNNYLSKLEYDSYKNRTDFKNKTKLIDVKNNLVKDSTLLVKDEVTRFVDIVNKYENDYDFEALLLECNNIKNTLYEKKDYSTEAENIRNVCEKIEDYQKELEKIKLNLYHSTNEIQKLIPQIQNEIEKPQNKLYEMIKRLILSVVIISFFLAILRYIAKLYQYNYSLMVQAENEDLLIRKFYVSLKNTDKNNEERMIVLRSFLKEFELEVNKDSSTLSKEDAGMLKELINNLLKKL